MPKKLKPNHVSIPEFNFTYPKTPKSGKKLTLFDITSHHRARDAIKFGLSIQEPEFNLYVIGEDRTGRLNATLEFVEEHYVSLDPVDDWVYVYNFEVPQEPLPFRFPQGRACSFQRDMKKFVHAFAAQLLKKFNSEEFTKKLQKPTKKVEEDIQAQLEALREFSLKHNIDIVRNADGTISPVPIIDGKEKKGKKTDPSLNIWNDITERLQSISLYAEYESEQINDHIEKLKQKEAEKILKPLMEKYLDTYREIQCIQPWLNALNEDIIQHLDWFVQERGEEETIDEDNILNRYSVNVFIQSPEDHPPVIVEPNPTYEKLFGKISYKNTANGYQTNFSMMTPGSLHRANGGVLIIRADALAQNPESWTYLKYALRDRVIRIEELHRANSLPVLEAPNPKEIPLDLKVVLIGSPLWFYSYFYQDMDFMTYFKIKADIGSDFEATSRNISTMAKLIQRQVNLHTDLICSKRAMSYVLGFGARIAEDRKRISAHIEAILDVVYEAGSLARSHKSTQIHLEHVKEAIDLRDKRNSLLYEGVVKSMKEGVLNITTQGEKVGQINGLTVQSAGGFAFGMPSRITAQTSIGNRGIVNIEQQVEMSGPIQEKGVLVLEGFLRGTFARDYPLSCNCSLTFEQTYGEVDGDSASVAELCAILSSLSRVPLKQNIALTGSLNQFGEVQSIGGVNEKIEGFYHVCETQGLTGDQGVIIPASNEKNVILKPQVVEAIEKGEFHLWTVKSVTEALDILTDQGHKDVFNKVEAILKQFDEALKGRGVAV